MTKQEYEEQVDPEFCGIQSYMEWVKFSDSFPPLPAEPLPKIRFYLILSYGSIRVIGLYRKLGKDCSIVETSEFFKNIINNNKYWENSYWRYLPPPPSNQWYNDSGISPDIYLEELDKYLH